MPAHPARRQRWHNLIEFDLCAFSAELLAQANHLLDRQFLGPGVFPQRCFVKHRVDRRFFELILKRCHQHAAQKLAAVQKQLADKIVEVLPVC